MKPSHQSSTSFEHLFFHSSETYVHPTAVVGPNVTLAHGTKIGPHAIIQGNVSIGENTQIHAHAVIGSTAQDITIRKPLGQVTIGNNVVIKEFATVSAPKTDNGETFLGENVYLMHFAHVGHDAHIEHHSVLTNYAQVGGHAHISHHVYLMANTGVHQHCHIGPYTALAPESGTRQDLPPFCLFNGSPGRFSGLNTFLLKRENFTSETINILKRLTSWFYREKLSVPKIEELIAEHSLQDHNEVKTFMSFVRTSKRGISRQRITD